MVVVVVVVVMVMGCSKMQTQMQVERRDGGCGIDLPMQMSVPRSWSVTPSLRACALWRTTAARAASKGSANPMWPTQPSSKNVQPRTPLVRSMIWSGRRKSRGRMYSWREPTAEKAMIVRTPRERKAAMLAREGTS